MSEPKHISEVLQDIKDNLITNKGDRADTVTIEVKCFNGMYRGHVTHSPELTGMKIDFYTDPSKSFLMVIVNAGDKLKSLGIFMLSCNLKIEYEHVNR